MNDLISNGLGPVMPFQDGMVILSSPGQLGGIKAWLRADTGITLVSSKVSQWDSPLGNCSPSQATVADRPSTSTSPSGLTVVSFADSSDNLADSGSNPDWNGLTAFTQFAVIYINSQLVATYQPFFTPKAGVESCGINSHNLSSFFVNIGNANYGAITPANGWHIIEAVYDGSGTGNAGRLKIWDNGAAQTPTYTGTIPASCPNSSGMRVGSTSGQTGPSDKAAENIMVNRVLTASLRTSIRRYLANKWGITGVTFP